MKTIKLPDNTAVTLYNSIKEAPGDVWSKHQNYLMQSAGIGSDMESVGLHYERLSEFIRSDKKDFAMTELQNLYYNLFYAMKGIHIDSYAFGCLIHSVGGEKVEDYSEDNLTEILSDLMGRGLTVQLVEQVLDEVKKK